MTLPNTHVIFGAPGCGKTKRLMDILSNELTRHAPDKIAFVSFTRKGTYEGVKRAQEQFSLKEDDLPYFRTLHSIAFRTGEYSKYDIIAKRHYKEFSVALDMNFTGFYTEDFFNNDDRYLFLCFLERSNKRAAEYFAYDMDTAKLQLVRTNYERFKKFRNVVDFTDILETFVARNEPLPVEVAIIDEAQDLTTLQWRMCEIAFRNCKRIYIAGDDDQSIYEWSGADVQYFLGIKGKREILNQSYRLPSQILELSKGISAMITQRVNKEFHAISDKGTVQFYNSVDELLLSPNETYYFLSRNNYFLFIYREFLRKRAMVYMDKDKCSVSMREVEAINLFERSRKQPLSDTEEMKLRPFLNSVIDKTKPWYDNLKLDIDTMAYYKDLIRSKTDLKDYRIQVNTIHGVKGGEADNVVLILDFTKAVKMNMENNPNSELRCLYVACTRAKKHLHIIYSNSRNGYDAYVRMGEKHAGAQ